MPPSVRLIDLDSLQTTLLAAKLQTSNPALYQTINNLIKAAKQNQSVLNTLINQADTDVTTLEAIVNMLIGRTYLTENDETSDLPNSRQLLAGTNIAFDDSVPGERTISASGGGGGLDYVVMSDGAIPTPSPMDDGFGNFMYIPYTP